LVLITVLIGPVLGGALAAKYSPSTAYIASLVPALTGLVIIAKIPFPSNWAARKANATVPISPESIAIIVLFLVLGLEMGLVRPVQSLLLMDKFGVSWASLGMVTALATLAGAVAAAIGGLLSDRLGREKILLFCLLPAATIITFLPLAAFLGQAAVLIFVYNFLGSAAFPALAALGMEAVPPKSRAVFAGLTSTALNLGAAGGSAGSGWLYTQALWLPFATAGLVVILTLPPLIWTILPLPLVD
jgi:MFS family permease